MALPHVTRNSEHQTLFHFSEMVWERTNIVWHDSSLSYPMQMHFHVETFDTGHHWMHWTSLPLSHDLPTRPPTTTWQHATSRAPVECQMSITFLIPFQPPSCFLQPWSQCLLWPREDGRWSDRTLIDPEWGHWNQPRTCWWVSGLCSMFSLVQ